jgi:hypothetical protein
MIAHDNNLRKFFGADEWARIKFQAAETERRALAAVAKGKFRKSDLVSTVYRHPLDPRTAFVALSIAAGAQRAVPRIHFARRPCGFCRGRFGALMTTNLAGVTCRLCRAYIDRHGLRPRDEFPQVPTFDVLAVGKFRSAGSWGTHLEFTCPVCGILNRHGRAWGPDEFGSGDGGRVSHCGCWERGYRIREIRPAGTIVTPHLAVTTTEGTAFTEVSVQ